MALLSLLSRRIAARPAFAAAAASSVAYLAAPAPPAQCLLGFGGKSKEVLRLEEENARLLSEAVNAKAELMAVTKEKEALAMATEKLATEKDALAHMKSAKTQLMELSTDLGSGLAEIGSTGVPQNLSYGFVAGYCSGFAAKKAGKVLAAVLGSVYIGLQCLAFNGFIDINHSKIGESFENMADLNKDGKVDAEDLKIAKEKGMQILSYGVAASSGFATGVALGLRQG